MLPLLINSLVCALTYGATEVALHQSLGIQLGLEAAAELHQLVHGGTRHQSLVLLHHGPARVFQDQQADVSDRDREKRCVQGSHCALPPLEGIADSGMEVRAAANSLAELLGLDEDVEVALLELLCKHAEDAGGGGEVGQVVDDQVEQQLRGDGVRTVTAAAVRVGIIIRRFKTEMTSVCVRVCRCVSITGLLS